jgi:hypothetical protein
VEHVAYMEEMRNIYVILVKNWKVRDHFGDIDVNERLILK